LSEKINKKLQKLENNYPGLPLLSEKSQGEVGDNREKWGHFWEKSIAINRNIVSQPLSCPNLVNS
jgi:hypothetical protein